MILSNDHRRSVSICECPEINKLFYEHFCQNNINRQNSPDTTVNESSSRASLIHWRAWSGGSTNTLLEENKRKSIWTARKGGSNQFTSPIIPCDTLYSDDKM
jgi:hypothetical protein